MIGLLFNYTAEFHVIMEIFLRVFELKNWNYLTGLFFLIILSASKKFFIPSMYLKKENLLIYVQSPKFSPQHSKRMTTAVKRTLL